MNPPKSSRICRQLLGRGVAIGGVVRALRGVDPPRPAETQGPAGWLLETCVPFVHLLLVFLFSCIYQRISCSFPTARMTRAVLKPPSTLL